MANNATDVANLALRNLGVGPPIVNLEEDGRLASILRSFYGTLQSRLLSSYDWSFAMRQVQLAPSSYAPLSKTVGDTVIKAWDYAYSYPADCVRFVRIVSLEDWENFPRFATYNDPVEGKVILTNESPAFGEYVRELTAVTDFDAIFVHALAWLLSANIALAVTGNPEIMSGAQQMHERILVEAGLKTAREQQDLPNVYPGNRLATGDREERGEGPGRGGLFPYMSGGGRRGG